MVSEISDAEFSQLTRLGYRDGCIRGDLHYIHRHKVGTNSWVVMVKDENLKIRSWGLADDQSRWRLSYIPRTNRHMFQIWTQHRWRRLGLGSKVVAAMRKVVPSFDFYRPENPKFFNACNL